MSTARPKTIPHIAVVLHATGDPELAHSVAFWVEACRLQLLEHAGPAWAAWAPPPMVAFYGNAEGLPPTEAGVVGIFRSAGNPQASGYHAAIGQRVIGAVDLGTSACPSRTLSHEVLEMYRNAFLSEWAASPQYGREYAAELCDPVQTQEYTIHASVMGETREVVVGNFLLPGWFDLDEKTGRVDHLGQLPEPFAIGHGGYQIAREGDSILWLPAPGEGMRAQAARRPLSRTSLISDGIVIPH